MSGETTRLTEPQLRELAARGAAELDGATATDMLRWPTKPSATSAAPAAA
ncbi:phosphoadenosine phosphosulfate reductase [Mycobacterium tuberculosis]|nr:phosphoadenosine phosphosulfate reductase [Mycobacterium tuberculosis]CKS85778.1 phosphoadenosine phosphosulfate reductase [Mycobacterium tuberculosis]